MNSKLETQITFKRNVGFSLVAISLYPLYIFANIHDKLLNIKPSAEYLATTVLMGLVGLMLIKGEVDKSPKIILGKAFVLSLLIIGLSSLVSK